MITDDYYLCSGPEYDALTCSAVDFTVIELGHEPYGIDFDGIWLCT